MSKKQVKPENVVVKIKPENVLSGEVEKCCKVTLREFFNMDEKAGKQVTMSAKDHKYVTDSFKRMVKAQSILENLYKN